MNDRIAVSPCKIDISVRDTLGYFNRQYFSNSNSFWRHILCCHGFARLQKI